MRRFELGLATITPGALAALGSLEVSPSELLERHASGDWGDVPHEDARENEYALEHGFRVMSSYPLSGGVRVWVITERDRSLTTILLPEEY
jgi:hypothetical protein